MLFASLQGAACIINFSWGSSCWGGVITPPIELVPLMLASALTERPYNRSSLRRQIEILARDAAQLKKPNQRFLDQIVRARCSRGNANNSRPVRQPKMRNHFPFFVQIVMLDFSCRDKP